MAGISFAHATKQEQLKSIEAGKRLQFDQARDKPILHGANSKIHDQKAGCVVSFGTSKPDGIAVAACRANSAVRVFPTISLAAAYDFIVKFARKKNRCLRDPEIRRPFLGFVYTTQAVPAYFSGVKSALKRARSSGCTNLVKMTNDECPMTKE